MPDTFSRTQILAQNVACNPLCHVCHYKDRPYPAQLLEKQRWADQQLSPWRDVLQQIIQAPEAEQLAYRSKTWMRSGVLDDGLSFGMLRSRCVEGIWEKELISWDTCPLHIQPIQEVVQKLRESLAGLPASFLEKSLVGVWIGSPHLVLVCREPDIELLKQLNWNLLLSPPLDRVWFHQNPQVGRKVFGHRPIQQIFGPSLGSDSVHPIRAFRQNAQTLLVRARALAVQALLKPKPSLVVELYCGTGDLSLLLPPEVGWLGIELSTEAVKYANTLRPARKSLHTAFVGAVEQRLHDPNVVKRIQGSYSLYINPPRSGLTREARDRIFAVMRDNLPATVVYLSCSASSLARDLREFESLGYRVDLLQPYDFFPQTEHFETLATLTRI